MHQQEIQFFWPATEQIPLDLDYTKSEKPKPCFTSGTMLMPNGGTGSTWAFAPVTSANFNIDIDRLSIIVSSTNKPNLARRFIYKILGVNWKVK